MTAPPPWADLYALHDSAHVRDATIELRHRRDAGHTAGCLCQCRQGRSCAELRRIVGWQVAGMVFARDDDADLTPSDER